MSNLISDEEVESKKRVFRKFLEDVFDSKTASNKLLMNYLVEIYEDKIRAESYFILTYDYAEILLRLTKSMNIALSTIEHANKEFNIENFEKFKSFLDKMASEGNPTAKTVIDFVQSNKTISAKKSADARHGQKGGTREKQEKIRQEWATGKYRTRNECAEKNYDSIGVSYETARKALRNTPDPKKP